MIPGDNLAEMAFEVIGTQTVAYYQNTSRTSNAIKTLTTVYADPTNIEGSLQPIPRNKYVLYGLDLNKDYATFYTLTNLLDLKRGVSGDKIVFENNEYKCQSANDWIGVDGWTGVICVFIGRVEVPKKKGAA